MSGYIEQNHEYAIWGCNLCGKTISHCIPSSTSPNRIHSHGDNNYFIMGPINEAAKAFEMWEENFYKNPPPSEARARMFMDQVNW